MTTLKLLAGMIAVAVLCLPFWARGRKILAGLSRMLLWGVCAITAVTALAVLVEGNGDPRKLCAALLLGVFVVYTALVARSLRAKSKNTVRDAGKI